jgi:DNA ligase (NAD+)
MTKIDRIKALTKELLHHCYLYYDLDALEISDAEYDKKFDELKRLEDEANFWLANSPTRKVQGEVLPYLTKVRHSKPMLSADKSTDIEDVKKFVRDKEICASFKLDGSTVVVKYDGGKFIQGLSRGSGTDGEDITHTVKMIKNLPMTIPYKWYLEIRGEAVIPWKYYNAMNVDGSLGHPRNVASGALRQLDANEAEKRNIYFYAFTLVNWKWLGIETKSDSLQFLKENGFDVVPFESIYPNELEKTMNFFDRALYENPTDGWCFEYNDLYYGESLGSTGHHDRRLFALKPEVEEYETTLRDIEWTLGKTGQLTPTAVFDPVEIDNTIVTKASVHNISIIKNLKLKIGEKCFVHKANMIIPQILRCDSDVFDVEIPKYCPVCGGETEVVTENASEVLMCKNPNCSGKLLGKLKFFVSKPAMNIDGLSEATLEKFIELGWLAKFIDIYYLDVNKADMVKLDGFGEKSVNKLLESIEKSKNIKLENFICALSIDGVGKSASKTIAEAFNGDFYQLLSAFKNGYNWADLQDIGDKTSTNITKYFTENEAEIVDLASEMRFSMPTKTITKQNPFSGKTLCVTGKLNHFTRDSINAKIIELGAKATGSVSKNTNYLITNEQSGSSKYKKALELNIPIITEDEFLTMIGDSL